MKDLFFEKVEGSVIKLDRVEDTVGIEPGLKAGVNAVEVKELHTLINLKDVGVINDVQAVRLMEGCRKLGKKAVCANAN
jgi:hypothetical protein